MGRPLSFGRMTLSAASGPRPVFNSRRYPFLRRLLLFQFLDHIPQLCRGLEFKFCGSLLHLLC